MTPKPRAIHQFHSGSAYGDAVTNSLFFTQSLLRGLGYVSDVFVEHLAPELKDRIHDFRDYNPNPENVLLVHHSMGHDRLDWILGIPDKKILVYHNITPPHFFVSGSHTQRYAQKGYDMLDSFRDAMSASIAISEENRIELDRRGYPITPVVPLLFDQERVASAPWNDNIVQTYSSVPIVLFVGRFAPNKGQIELVEIARHLHSSLSFDFRMVMVGGYDPQDHMYKNIEERINDYGLNGRVTLAGKVSDNDLMAWYRAASVYCSMSEHEGFGVPFLEAMTFDLPIVALASSAIPSVLGEAGLMIGQKDARCVAALIAELIENRPLRRTVILAQRRRLLAYSRHEITSGLCAALRAAKVECPEKSATNAAIPRCRPFDGPEYQIEGPAESSYSLALVNRNYALALNRHRPGCVGMWITEGPGDYIPKDSDLGQHPEVAALWRRSLKAHQPKVVIRNLWPPRVADADGLINLAQFAWEESFIPPSIIADFNRHLDGVLVPSFFCRDALINNGLALPVCVAGHGMDHIEGVSAKPISSFSLPDGFRFLHISSAFPRKGVDALLVAWPAVVAQCPTATLILKTFPNPHNDVGSLLTGLQANNPEAARRVFWINQDLSTSEIVWLYQNADAFVSPTRGEGYGLPLAEAMVYGLPVITTDRGGHADFCRKENAWLVRTKMVSSRSHAAGVLSQWFEPDRDSLACQLVSVYHASPSEKSFRVNNAREFIGTHTWSNVVDRTAAFVAKLESRAMFPKPRRVGFVTTWNERCGIATYSRFLIEELLPRTDMELFVLASSTNHQTAEDEPYVYRCWSHDFTSRCDVSQLEQTVNRLQLETVVIQFNFGFLNLGKLGVLLDSLHSRGINTITTLHSTKDVDKADLQASLRSVRESFSKCYRILVHSPADLRRLDEWNMAANVSLFPHGLLPYRTTPSTTKATRQELGWDENHKILATFGFCLPHKGLRETIKAFAQVHRSHPHLRLLLLNAQHPNPDSAVEAQACRELIATLGCAPHIVMRTDFLPEPECLRFLSAADLTIFLYQNTAESASGAIRLALSASPLVVCAPLSIFRDVRDVVHMTPGIAPQDLELTLKQYLEEPSLFRQSEETRRKYFEGTSWQWCAQRLVAMILASSFVSISSNR